MSLRSPVSAGYSGSNVLRIRVAQKPPHEFLIRFVGVTPMYESDQNVPVISGNYVLKRINSELLKSLQRLASTLHSQDFEVSPNQR